MKVESPTPASTPSGAVFLSYASEDTEAARRLCDALRAAGVALWFDQSELRGGDAWDQRIRRQIRECALFIPIISTRTSARREGYFRFEWDLADQRTHMIARDRAFILPVCIDATPEGGTDIPDSFQRVHWTRLPEGEANPAFIARVKRLLSGEAGDPAAHLAPEVASPPGDPSFSLRRVLPGVGVLALLAAAAWLALEKPRTSNPVGAGAFTPPPHSVAVLPFVNMSGDKQQEYFSDGLTEELLNSLAAINELQVAARTSAFSFKGKDTDLPTIARKLNVGAILEGSVRRSGRTIRVSAELINAVTGFQLWSRSYDRDLGDVLKLQTEVATAVAGALRVTLLADIAQKIELGGTRDPAAFDAYLRASKATQSRRDASDLPAAIAAFSEAIRLDPNYALAYVGRSNALADYTEEAARGRAVREGFEKADSDARRALEIAPDLAEAHLALAYVIADGTLDFARASEEFERALALAPGNAQVLRLSGGFAAYMGHFDEAIAAAHHAVVLDPLDRRSHAQFGFVLYAAGRYQESAAAFAAATSLTPDFDQYFAERGLALYSLGDLEGARLACEARRGHWVSRLCLALVYAKLGRDADARAELDGIQAAEGDAAAYQYGQIYAQWGDRKEALHWLADSMRLRDPGLIALKTDPLFDPLRGDPGFQATLRKLKFPD
jgi:TolB-like protein/Tfp pilus assembly protein PilF